MDWMLGRLTVLGLGAAGVLLETCDVGVPAAACDEHVILLQRCPRLEVRGV
jgi:hypothetical protein